MTVIEKDVRALGAPAGEGITVYGADWCGDTRRSRALLDRLGVSYVYVDVDEDDAASAWVAAQNGGRRRLPTIVVGADGPTLAEPSDVELAQVLRDAGLAEAA